MVFSIYFRLLEVIDRISKLIDSSPNSVEWYGFSIKVVSHPFLFQTYYGWSMVDKLTDNPMNHLTISSDLRVHFINNELTKMVRETHELVCFQRSIMLINIFKSLIILLQFYKISCSVIVLTPNMNKRKY